MMRRCVNAERLAIIALLGTSPSLLAGWAEAAEVKDCDDAGVGVESISSPPVRLYDGKATAYTVDTVEPAAAPAGVAIVVPTPEEESPVGGYTCWAVTGFSSIDLAKAKRSYDRTRGLLLEIPTTVPKDGEIVAGSPLRLRINLGKGSVTSE